MREIKFRSWSDNREMIYDIQNDKLTNDNSFDRITFGGWLNNKRHVIMQYTGSRDKDGKEIYDGDILDLIYLDMINMKWRKARGFIKWAECAFYVEFIDNNSDDIKLGHSKILINKLKVIGNKYENPELYKRGGEK